RARRDRGHRPEERGVSPGGARRPLASAATPRRKSAPPYGSRLQGALGPPQPSGGAEDDPLGWAGGGGGTAALSERGRGERLGAEPRDRPGPRLRVPRRLALLRPGILFR